MKRKLTLLIAGICASIAVNAQQHAYWKFDEAVNSTRPVGNSTPFIVPDSWGNKNGRIADDAWITESNQNSDISFTGGTTAFEGNALRFRGKANSYVKLPDGLMSGLNDFTVSFYYRHIANREPGVMFDFGTGNGAENRKHMRLSSENNAKLVYHVQNGATEHKIEAPYTFLTGTGQFYHIVITQTGGTVTMYATHVISGMQTFSVNEVKKETGINIRPSDFGQTTYNYLGKSRYDAAGVLGIDGVFDEFKIYGRGLTPNEVLELFINKTLPVSFLDFSAKKQSNGSVLLDWSTASEKENSHFEILRSTDGVTFNNIANVSGNGNSNELKKYQHVDHNPQTGNNYYQLKQVDFNGKSSVHPDVKVVFAGLDNGDLKIFANDNKLKVQANVGKKSGFRVSLTDLSGKVCAEFNGQVVPGSNSFEFPISNLTNGIYVVTYQSDTEKISNKIQLVK